MAKILIQLLLICLPWPLRRRLLGAFFGFKIDPAASIGLSLIASDVVQMGPHSRIGHLTFVKGLSLLDLASSARLGNLNWVTGQARATRHFSDQLDRRSELIVGEHSAITHRHLIDCTDSVIVGKYSTFGGWGSQILTHSIEIGPCRQISSKVSIGDYCFVGTRVVILKGSRLPSYSVLAPGSVLGSSHSQEYSLYGGVPAKHVKDLDKAALYFRRESGFVN